MRRFVPLILLAVALPAVAQEVRLDLPAADEGLRAVLEAASLTLTKAREGDADAQDLVAAARADYRQILTGLYAAGHYGGTVSIAIDGREAAGIAALDAPDVIAGIVIAVVPGPVFSFGAVSVAPLAPGTVLPAGVAAGQVAGSEAVRDAVRQAVEGWREAGHAQARPADQTIRALHDGDRLDVAVTLAPGPLLRFGALEVAGNEAVRTARIIEIAGLPTGRVYSPADLALAATRLRRTGAFRSVTLTEAEAVVPPDLLPILAEVSEMKPRRLGFGAEISSVDGLALTAFWLHRNLMGGAERFRIDGSITGIEGQTGGPDAEITLSYGRPATFGPDTDLTADAALSFLDEPDFRLWQATGDVGLIRYVRDDLTYEAGVGFLTAHEETAAWTRDYTLLTLPLTATLDRRSDPLDAVSGYYLNLDMTPFLGLQGGDSGGRILADARAFRSFGVDDRVTLAARVQAGSVLGAGLMQAPADFLFYSGGGGTVRGQPYQALGIDISRDIGGGLASIRRGGTSFLGAQLEARVQVTEKIEVVGFYDWGTIDIEPWPGDGALWHAGAGLGLRYATGIGPIRLDLATPASGDDAGDSLQVYIGIGQSF